MVFLSTILLAPTGTSRAQSGGLDGFGCHHNRQTGGYHCHHGPLAGQRFSSQEEAVKALDGSSGKQRTGATPKRGLLATDTAFRAAIAYEFRAE